MAAPEGSGIAHRSTLYVPETHSDITDLIPDTGYRPQVRVEEGVSRPVAWHWWYYGI